MRRRAIGVGLAAVLGLSVGAVVLATSRRPASAPMPLAPPAPLASASTDAAGAQPPNDEPDPAEEAAQCAVRPLRLPKGDPPALTCLAARRVIAQVKRRAALPMSSPNHKAFAEAISGWLDPHGMWSAAPDSPVRLALTRYSAKLIRDIEASPSDSSPCDGALEVGRVTHDWVDDLRISFHSADKATRRASKAEALSLASEGLFQDDPVTRPGRALAVELGQRIAAFRSAFGADSPTIRQAESRLLPELGVNAWSEVVLAAAVRAYVPTVDPHGQWAPFEEEWSLYSSDPALATEPRLWGRMLRTALGVKILEDPTPPLRKGDLVLQVASIPTVGLSVEQVEQLSHLESVGGETTRSVAVLRRGAPAPVELRVALDTDETPAESPELVKTNIAYGDGAVWVVSIPDVPDELGDEVEELVESIADEPAPPLGIVLDLRGNGGGSLDGAVGAIGVFLPGVPCFPLRRRDGGIEVQSAATPQPSAQWRGPVAAIVDGYTASAAEMIAGALGSYQRGPVVGSRTFGKGCVQEYFDDRAGAGVLRLTTMLFSLPDGSPLQGVGLTPGLPMTMPAADERERAIPGALDPWRGPDVRSAAAMGGPDWPPHHGRIGPCEDAVVCAAMRRLGQPRRSAAVLPGRGSRRASH